MNLYIIFDLDDMSSCIVLDLQCVLGVADDKLITLRLQVPEAYYKGSPKGSTVVDEVDNIVKSFSVGNIL